MNKNIYKEILVVIPLMILGFVCNKYTMAIGMSNGLHGILIILFVILSVIIWRTSAQDERDAKNQAVASDIGFTAAGIILSIGIISQIFTGKSIDPWLLFTLIGMSLIRVTGRVWLDKNN